MLLFKRSSRQTEHPLFLTPSFESVAGAEGYEAASAAAEDGKPLSALWKAGLITFAFALALGTGGIANKQILSRPDAQPIGGLAVAWKESAIAYKDGKEVFSTRPSNGFAAGIRSTLLLSINTPVEQMIGKPISVTASFWKGGDPIVIADNLSVSERNGGGDNTRIMLGGFGVPLAGLWRFDVKVGGEDLGYTVLDVPDVSWVPSRRAPLVEREGWLERSVAMEGPDFVAGQPGDYMWYLLGNRSMTGTFKVEAIQRNTTKRKVIFEAPSLGEAKYGAAATVASMMTLPAPGFWRLTAYVDGKVFGSFIVEAR